MTLSPWEPADSHASAPLQDWLPMVLAALVATPFSVPVSLHAESPLQESWPMRIPLPIKRHAPSTLHEFAAMMAPSPVPSKLQKAFPGGPTGIPPQDDGAICGPAEAAALAPTSSHAINAV